MANETFWLCNCLLYMNFINIFALRTLFLSWTLIFRPGEILLVLCISTGQETYESFWEVVFQTRKQLCLPSALALLITQFLLQGSAAHGDLSSVEGQVMCSLNSLPFCFSLWNQQVHMYWRFRIRTWILGKVVMFHWRHLDIKDNEIEQL